jgi:hypothetical protein
MLPPPVSPPRFLFFLLLGSGLLALCAGYAALVLHQATWAETQQLNEIFPFYHWKIRAFTAAELHRAARWLTIAAAALGAGWLLLRLRGSGRHEQRRLQSETGFFTGFRQRLAHLSPAQRRGAAGALAALTAVRLVMSLPEITPAYDDGASYTLFVSKGLLAVSSYYPLPNNHVLSNTLSWLFFQVQPGFWWTMRLPVVLAATAATVILFAGLLREKVPFRPAVLATGLFSLSQFSLYHAAVGRGYWLLTACAGVVFFSALGLVRTGGQTRRGWRGLVVGGVLGAYTVPTFALVLASAFSWLGLRFLGQRNGAGLLRLAAAGGLVGLGTLLLYAPLLFVSGPAKLFNNGFVTPLPTWYFLKGLPRYLWETEGLLAGQAALGGLLVLGGALATAGLAWQAWRRRLPAGLAPAWQRLAPALGWFLVAPYGVLLAQRVLAPGRTLFYKAFFFFTLLALAVEWLLRTRPAATRRWLRPLLGLAALLWTAYQFRSLARDNRTPYRHNAAYHEAFAWLARQPAGPTLVPEPTHAIFLGLYFRSEAPAFTWQAHAEPHPGTTYAYAVAFPNKRGYFQPRFAYPPAFRNEEVEIYRIPATAVSAGLPAYWHLVE